jgi:hypothetical protein
MHTSKSKRLEKDSSGMQKPKASRNGYSLSDKAYVKQKSVRRDKKGHYILIKGTIQQEDKIILNLYSLNIGAPTFIKQTL